MARCEGTTRSGDQCKRDARPESRFCYVHNPEEAPEPNGENEAAAEEFELLDLAPILLAGALTVGMVLLLKGFGKLIPRL